MPQTSLHCSTFTSVIIRPFHYFLPEKPPNLFPYIHCKFSPIPSSHNIQKSLHNAPSDIMIFLNDSSMVLSWQERVKYSTPRTAKTYLFCSNPSLTSVRINHHSDFPEQHFLQSQVLSLDHSQQPHYLSLLSSRDIYSVKLPDPCCTYS